MLCGRYEGLKTLNGGGVDGGVVQVIPVGRSLDKEARVSQLVCAAAWDFVGSIVVSYVVTNGVPVTFSWKSHSTVVSAPC